MSSRSILIGLALATLLAPVARAEEAAQTPEARIEAVKQSLTTSKATLKSYEWVQTVALSLGGEEKVNQQYTCYQGADGALQKVPVAADAKESKKRGLRGKVVESKTEELKGSLKAASDLIDQYTPLDPARIQAAKAAGNVSVSVPGADGKIRIGIKNYLKAGDTVDLEIDAAKNTLQSVAVSSFVEQGKDKSPVTAKMSYAALEDGTLYPAKSGLDIPAQKLKVDVSNSGYRKKSS